MTPLRRRAFACSNLIVCFFRRRADSNEAVRSIVGTAKFQSMFRRNVDGTWSLVLLNKGAATMTSITKILLGATAGAAILASSVITASAAIVCSGNTCWHVHERYTYPPSAGVVIHEDDWRAGPGITFREHEGRGYWHGDRWSDF
jgi:hypothetical protein